MLPRTAAAAGAFPGELFGYFGLACAVTGAAVLLTFYLGANLRLWWIARQWPSAECTVVRVDPSLTYSYTVAGRTYESGRTGIGDENGVAGIAVGARMECFYDPSAPGEALLNRSWDGWWWLPGAWALALFMLLTTAPQLLSSLWQWATYRPNPPLTWAQWFATFYADGAWMYTVVGLAALVPGLAMTIFMTIVPWKNWWDASRWTETQCEMTAGGGVRAWSSSGTSGRGASGGYVLDIAYRYAFGGKQYTGTSYSPWRLGGTDWMLQASRADEMGDLQQKFAPGTRHRCFVSPDRPERSYLSRDRENFGTYVSCIGPFLSLIGWIVLCSRR